MIGIMEEFFNEVFNLGVEVLIIGALVSVLVSVALFFLLREFYAWYSKTNKVIALQKEQNETLKRILAELQNKK